MWCKRVVIRKLQQLTCDKADWNRRFLQWHKCLKEAEKALECKEIKKH